MSSTPPYGGVVVPMVTPFLADGQVDTAAVARIVEYLVPSGVTGLFVLGTTGEGPSLDPSGKLKVMEAVITAAGKQITVYASVSDNSQSQSIQAARDYAKLGASAIAAHVPSFFPLSDADIERYFRQLADASPLPLMLYNIPKTTHASIALEVIARLAEHPNIVGIKDSDGSTSRMTELLQSMKNHPRFAVLSGSGQVFAHALKCGAHGLVPSTANLHPVPYVAMCHAAQSKKWDEVDRLQLETTALTAGIQQGRSLGDSLALLKARMAGRGLCAPVMLPPIATVELIR